MYRNFYIPAILLFLFVSAKCQFFGVEEGSVSFSGNTVLVCNNLNEFENNAEFTMEDSSVISIEGTNELTFAGNEIVQLNHIQLTSDVILENDVDVKGNIEFDSGIIDLFNSIIKIKGKLVNETNSSKITSTGYGVIETSVNLSAGIEINPSNLGFSFTPQNDLQNVILQRGHKPELNNDQESINRYYSFYSVIPQIQDFTFNYLSSELNNNSAQNLGIWGLNNGTWYKIVSSTNNIEQYNVSAIGNADYSLYTLFDGISSDGIFIPEGFSPNGDGVNDEFVVIGLEAYSDNALVIFNRWGHKVFEAAPYNNDWTGKNYFGISVGPKDLPVGTYYYILKLDKKGDNNRTGNVFLNR